MKIRRDRVGSIFGHGYSDMIRGTLKVTKSVEITDRCPNRAKLKRRGQVILDYAQGTFGVKVCLYNHQPNSRVTTQIVNSVSDLVDVTKRFSTTFWFLSSAKRLGFTPEQFIVIVKKFAPRARGNSLPQHVLAEKGQTFS